MLAEPERGRILFRKLHWRSVVSAQISAQLGRVPAVRLTGTPLSVATRLHRASGISHQQQHPHIQPAGITTTGYRLDSDPLSETKEVLQLQKKKLTFFNSAHINIQWCQDIVFCPFLDKPDPTQPVPSIQWSITMSHQWSIRDTI
jgi:hypothetical protein